MTFFCRALEKALPKTKAGEIDNLDRVHFERDLFRVCVWQMNSSSTSVRFQNLPSPFF